MANKFTNNLPGYGYARLKPKIYTSYTGLFTGSKLYASASYGARPVTIKINKLPVTKIEKIPILNSCNYNIILDMVILTLINKTTIDIKFRDITINKINKINNNIATNISINIDTIKSLIPLKINFYLYNYYKGELGLLDIENKNLLISNISPLYKDKIFYHNLNKHMLFNRLNLYSCQS